MFENAGSPVVFACIQRAQEWLTLTSSGGRQSAGGASTKGVDEAAQVSPVCLQEEMQDDSGPGPVYENEGDDDEWTSGCIRRATEEAYAAAVRIKAITLGTGGGRRGGEEGSGETLPPSARGLWRYTVGLVGTVHWCHSCCTAIVYTCIINMFVMIGG